MRHIYCEQVLPVKTLTAMIDQSPLGKALTFDEHNFTRSASNEIDRKGRELINISPILYSRRALVHPSSCLPLKETRKIYINQGKMEKGSCPEHCREEIYFSGFPIVFNNIDYFLP